MKHNASNELKQHSEDSPGNSLLSPGALLQEARHELGLTQAEVARRLCLTIKVIASIERDEYKDLHGLSYIRGYLRSYANLLNISADKVLLSFERQGFVNHLVSPEKYHVKELSSMGNKKDYFTKGVSYILIITFITMSFLWWYEHRNSGLTFLGTLDMDLTKLNRHSINNIQVNNLQSNDIGLNPDLAFYTLSQDNMELSGDNVFGRPYLFNSNDNNGN